MSEKRHLTNEDYIVVTLFTLVLVSALAFTLSGIPYVVIESSHMSFWLSILMPVGAILSGIIFSYSLAQFILEK